MAVQVRVEDADCPDCGEAAVATVRYVTGADGDEFSGPPKIYCRNPACPSRKQ